MHIPDHYLSPQTCAVMTAAVAPAWVVSIKRIRLDLPLKKISLMGVGAAFSFLGMMTSTFWCSIFGEDTVVYFGIIPTTAVQYSTLARAVTMLILGIVLLHFTSVAESWAGKIRWSLGENSAKLQLPRRYEVITSCSL